MRSPGCCATCPVRRAPGSGAINNSMVIAPNTFSLCHKDNSLTDTSACSLPPPPTPTSSLWPPLPWTPRAEAAAHGDPERLGALHTLEMLQTPAETALASRAWAQRPPEALPSFAAPGGYNHCRSIVALLGSDSFLCHFCRKLDDQVQPLPPTSPFKPNIRKVFQDLHE